jgi:hypothetical protein
MPIAPIVVNTLREWRLACKSTGAGSIRCPASITAGSIGQPTILMTGQSWVSVGGARGGLTFTG